MMDSPSHAFFSPAAERNAEPIASVLSDILPASGLVLEIASGTGQHAAFFSERFPRLNWQPTDTSIETLRSIEAYRARAGRPNFLPPLELNAERAAWPIARADAIFAANLIHISPWEVTLGLLAGAARTLAPSAPLILYGPYFVKGKPTAPSNLAFDGSLRARNPAWGVRELETVAEAASQERFTLALVTPMPANNLIVVFRSR